ncbi:hypothetical protein, partial [Neisseria meningitidis]|uniref:hypothetical protein n=1 Tax=Neisseria meningitidis TaxID=487 RepID=UPI001C59652E
KRVFSDGMGFPLLKKIDVAPMGQNFILQKPVRRCLALAQRERFSKVLKHQVNRFRTICLYCLRLRRLVLIFVNPLYFRI